MEREKFVKLVEEALGALPTRFRKRIHNVAVLVESVPPEQLPRRGSRSGRIKDSDDRRKVELGVFKEAQNTKKSVFDLSAEPHHNVHVLMNMQAVGANRDRTCTGMT